MAKADNIEKLIESSKLAGIKGDGSRYCKDSNIKDVVCLHLSCIAMTYLHYLHCFIANGSTMIFNQS